MVVDETGEVFGDVPNVAARVQAAAGPGSVLVTMNVKWQVAGLFVADERGARELKGVSAPVQLSASFARAALGIEAAHGL